MEVAGPSSGSTMTTVVDSFASVRSGGSIINSARRSNTPRTVVVDHKPPNKESEIGNQQERDEKSSTKRSKINVQRPRTAGAARRMHQAISKSRNEQQQSNSTPVRQRRPARPLSASSTSRRGTSTTTNNSRRISSALLNHLVPSNTTSSTTIIDDQQEQQQKPTATLLNTGSSIDPFSERTIEQSITLASASLATECEDRTKLCQILNDSAKSSTAFYSFGKVLGIGSFGKVRSAVHKLTTQPVAIKTYEKSKVKDTGQWKRVEQEVRLMRRLNHPNIARMFESIHLTKKIHIVMEHVTGKDLCQYVKAKRRLAESDARQIFEQVVCAVSYLHDLNVIHRDIKLENVLLDESRNVKLVDFGFSIRCKDDKRRLTVFCGTPSYMGPEIVQRKHYEGKPVDIWSLGVLLYAMLCGKFPFTAANYNDLYKKIMKGSFDIPDTISTSARNLLNRMLDKDPIRRMTIADVRAHQWLHTVSNHSTVTTTSNLPPMTSHLVSRNPVNDLVPVALDRISTNIGVSKQRTMTAVMQGHHNAITSLYYLLLLKAEVLRRRKQDQTEEEHEQRI